MFKNIFSVLNSISKYDYDYYILHVLYFIL